MKRKEIKWCSKQIRYSRKLYLGYVLMYNSQDILVPFALTKVFSSKDKMFPFADEVIKYFEDDFDVLDGGFLATINFDSLYPLQRKFWGDSCVEVDAYSRLTVFNNLLLYPANHRLLVVPSLYGKKRIFSPAMVFKNDVESKDIEAFMMASDTEVDQEASSAAFYRLDDITGVNWRTKEEYEKKPSLFIN